MRITIIKNAIIVLINLFIFLSFCPIFFISFSFELTFNSSIFLRILYFFRPIPNKISVHVSTASNDKLLAHLGFKMSSGNKAKKLTKK